MFITQKHLHRRTFLKGLGAAIALPLLDSMIPAGLRAATLVAKKSPVRLSFVYVPNGIVMDHWTPASEGAAFEYQRILKPVEQFRKDTLIISGLMDNNANALGDGGGDHARAGASFLTGAHPKKTGGSDIEVGVSADQVAAQAIGGATRFASLEFGLDDTRIVGHCDSGYSCAYTNSISWRTPTTPLPPEVSPRRMFERLFGDVDTSLDDATRARRARYRKSILDLTLDETKSVAAKLGASDRRKVDEYLDSIREIEKRIQFAEQSAPTLKPDMEKPAGIPTDFTEHAKLMYDLQALAFQADLTRVASMVVGREGSVRTYEQIGIPDPHHPLSHHRNNPESLEKLTRINTYHMELFAHFLEKLRTTPDGDGSLLDHSMILYGCGIADSNRHTHEKLPIMVVGRGDGSLQTGRHVDVKKDTPVTNLFLSLLDRVGVHNEKFGDSTGKLEV
jgi:Protein of unknown function (DUF1552)